MLVHPYVAISTIFREPESSRIESRESFSFANPWWKHDAQSSRGSRGC